MVSSNPDHNGPGIPEQDGNAVRERLLDEALLLFAKKGFEATSVREIVDAADVTRPTLYYHFRSKEGLYLELVERLCTTVEDMTLRSLVPQETARGRLRAFVLNILESVIEDASIQRHFFTIVLDPRRTMLSAFHERMRNFIAAILEVLLEDGVAGGEFEIDDVDLVRKAISAYVVSFIHNQIFIPDPVANRAETIGLLDRMLDQVAARPGRKT